MPPRIIFADAAHPLLNTMAEHITRDEVTLRGKIRRLFRFVRDEINVKASSDGYTVAPTSAMPTDSREHRMKDALFLTLCNALGVPARLSASTRTGGIGSGIRRAITSARAPAEASHSRLEVCVDGKWQEIDFLSDTGPFPETGASAFSTFLLDALSALAILSGISRTDLILGREPIDRM